MPDEGLIALPLDRAAALAGVSRRRVTYWASRGIVGPTVERRVGNHWVRLYGYADLMSLLITAELREQRGISLQAVRRIVEHLRSRGYERPLIQLRFAVDKGGKEVYFQHPSGEWEHRKLPDQTVMVQALDLEPLHARIRSATARNPETIGRIEKRRGTLGSKPVIAGTRVPVDTVVGYLEHGATTEDVLRAFPVLEEDDVEAARRWAS